MKIHTTNYFDTFIEVAGDTKTIRSNVPTLKGDKRTVAFLQYELLSKNPYRYTSDDLLFQVYALRNDLLQEEYKQAREQFFSKGQACLRASPLAKTYGFGIHSDASGKIALYGMEAPAYQRFLDDPTITKQRAMKSKR